MPKTEYYPDIARPGDPGFTSFPKHLPEDCVHYTIHILSSAPLSTSALRSRLSEVQRAGNDLSKSLLSGYIWQRESFALALVNSIVTDSSAQSGNDNSKSVEPEQKVPAGTKGVATARRWHLSGTTSYGDSVADEWLIVYLLRELSKKFQDAWIRVVDADEEFLLVEAATALPKWLNPEIASHRVWINNGQLRIIPKELPASTSIQTRGQKSKKGSRLLPRELDLEGALRFIETHREALLHSDPIEAEAFHRLRNYPTTIAESMHTASVTLPRNLAYILNRTPAHVSPAVEAFYLRDPISVRPLQAKTTQALRFPPTDLVTASVRFTRVSYAQLKSQEFPAPAAWASTLRNVEKTSEWDRREMGMKVACGFEMMLADPQNINKRAVREIEMLLEDVASGEDELPTDVDIKNWPQIENDESWLDVNFEDFEKELNGKKGKHNDNDTTGFGDKAAQENLRKMVERFEHFLNDDSAGEEGAEFSDDMDYDNDDDNDDDDDDDDDDDEVEDISPNLERKEDGPEHFDEDQLTNMMKQMMSMQKGSNQFHFDTATSHSARIEELDSDAESEEDETDMEAVMKRMEDELREAGALGGTQPRRDGSDEGDDAKYQLAKNLLESLKSQVGAAGPAGNLLGSMGLRLPRHEDER